MKTRTIAEDIDIWSSWQDGDDKKHVDEYRKQLMGQFWQLAGIKETETITEIGDFDSMSYDEAPKVAAWTQGLSVWQGEDESIVWKDGKRMAEIICGRGNWDMILNGKKYFESLRGPWWVYREVWLAEINARRQALEEESIIDGM